MPIFLHGIGDENGFELAFERPETPVADRILFNNEGGITMSRRALRSVLKDDRCLAFPREADIMILMTIIIVPNSRPVLLAWYTTSK